MTAFRNSCFSWILLSFAGLHSVLAANVNEKSCDRSWGTWNQSKQTCTCIASKQLITNEQDGSTCRAAHYSNWRSALTAKNQPQQNTCAELPPDNPNLQCPAGIVSQMVNSDVYSGKKGSAFGLVGSPDQLCPSTIDHDYASPQDLENHLATSPDSALGASPTMLSGPNSCLSNQPYSAVGHPRPYPNHDAKEFVGTYYYLHKRLEQGQQSTLESIASIDSILGQPPLHDVDCSDPILKKSQRWCEKFRAKKCSPQGGLEDKSPDGIVQKTVGWTETYDNLDTKEEDIKAGTAIHTGRGATVYRPLTPTEQDEIKQIETAKAAIASQYPWITGSEFRKYLNQHKAGMFGNGHPEYQYQNIHDAIYSQLTMDRKGSLQRISNLKRAGKCLNQNLFEYSSCKDLDEVIDETAPLSSNDPVIKDAQCRWNVDQAKAAVDHLVFNTAQTVVEVGSIVTLTMGLGTAAAAAEASAAAATEAGELAAAQQALTTVSAAKNLLLLGRLGLLFKGIKASVSVCGNKTVALTTPTRPGEDPEISCPAKAGANASEDPQGTAPKGSDCLIAIAMNSPFLLPLASPTVNGLLKVAPVLEDSLVSMEGFDEATEPIGHVQHAVAAGSETMKSLRETNDQMLRLKTLNP
jgi:hypothetical protein